MSSKLKTVGAYGALGAFSFLYFLYLGFPFDRVLSGRSYDPKASWWSPAKKVGSEFAKFERDAGMRIELGSLEPGWLFSVNARDVAVIPVARGRGLAAASDAPAEPMLRLEKVSISPRPFSLLTGKLGLGVKAQAYGGSVQGTIALGRKGTSIDLTARNLELAKYPMLSEKYQVNVTGQLGGRVDLTLDAADGTKTKGSIDLTIANARIDESNPYGIVQIPTTVFDRGGAAKIDFQDGKAVFRDVGLHGEELDVSLQGELVLKKDLRYSTWAATSSIKTSDAFKTAVPMLDVFMGPGKGGDGVYRYKLSGLMGRPRPTPDRSGGR